MNRIANRTTIHTANNTVNRTVNRTMMCTVNHTVHYTDSHAANRTGKITLEPFREPFREPYINTTTHLYFGGDVLDGPIIEVGAGHGVVRLHVMASRYCQGEDTTKSRIKGRDHKRENPVPWAVGMEFSFAMSAKRVRAKVWDNAHGMVVIIV